jgi:hypothetical protein
LVLLLPILLELLRDLSFPVPDLLGLFEQFLRVDVELDERFEGLLDHGTGSRRIGDVGTRTHDEHRRWNVVAVTTRE